jgi:hypothetical protein
MRQKYICHYCNKECFVQKWENNLPVCKKCCKYKNSLQHCHVCKEYKTVHSYIDENPVCCKCYNKQYKAPKQICSSCKELRAIHINIPKILCQTCYKKTYISHKKSCAKCNKIRIIVKRTLEGGICSACRTKERMAIDENFRIRSCIRKRISKLLKKQGKSKKFVIDYDAIITYLGPCPGEKKEYHIDHIFPLAIFDLKDKQQFAAATAPENHQWLKVSENCQKRHKFNADDFQLYLKKF